MNKNSIINYRNYRIWGLLRSRKSSGYTTLYDGVILEGVIDIVFDIVFRPWNVIPSRAACTCVVCWQTHRMVMMVVIAAKQSAMSKAIGDLCESGLWQVN